MAAMVKRDINKKGIEESEFPSVCESCLGQNPFIRMLKQDAGAECKICSRPFTVFRWPLRGQAKYQKTAICNSCCRIRNCCSICMLDLQFGLPIQIRDAALQLVKQGPSSEINREYHAQNQGDKHSDGEIPSEYGKAESAARALLKRLARSEPYARKRQALTTEASETKATQTKLPLVNSIQSRPSITDLTPPADKKITSLFVMGIEEDLPEHALRQYFAQYGPLKSVVCSHRSRCAFVNYISRSSAEAALSSTQGDLILRGCPLRVGWGKPRALSGRNNEQQNAEMARLALSKPARSEVNQGSEGDSGGAVAEHKLPPGQGEINYPSLRATEEI